MPNRDIDTSYGLEHKLSQSIDRMKDNITRSHELKRQIIKLRRQRRQMEIVRPDDIEPDDPTEDEANN